MDALFPLLVAATVAALSIGVWRVAASYMDTERRKLTERLSNAKDRFDPEAASARAIKIHLDSDSLPAILSKSQFFNELNRRLAQTLPRMTVVKFLSISGGLAAL